MSVFWSLILTKKERNYIWISNILIIFRFCQLFSQNLGIAVTWPLTKPGLDSGSDSGSDRTLDRIGLVSSLFGN